MKKLLGIEVDKLITGGCYIDYCKDDEMDWIFMTPAEVEPHELPKYFPKDNPKSVHAFNRLFSEDKIFLWEGTQVGICIPTTGETCVGGIVHDIDADKNSFWIGDYQFEGSGLGILDAIGIIGDDSRPRGRD